MDSQSIIPPHMGFVGANNDGFGGGGFLGAILIASLLGRRGFSGDDCRRDGDCGERILDTTILSKLGTVEGAIPLVGSQIQNSILEQTLGLQNQITQSSIAQTAATVGVKDAVQNGFSALLINNGQNTQSILTAICGLGSKIDQNLISTLQTELAESRSHSRSREVEVNVTQNVAQAQAQAQQQAQFSSLLTHFGVLAAELQNQKQSNRTIQFGAGNVATPTNTQQQVG